MPTVESPNVGGLDLSREFVSPVSFSFCNNAGQANAGAFHEVEGSNLLGCGGSTIGARARGGEASRAAGESDESKPRLLVSVIGRANLICEPGTLTAFTCFARADVFGDLLKGEVE